jgi:hypothetical protein
VSKNAPLVLTYSDAHESSILDEVLDLVRFFFASKSARSTRAVLDYTRLLPRLIFQFGALFEAPRHASWLLASSPPTATRLVLDSPLVCITAHIVRS